VEILYAFLIFYGGMIVGFFFMKWWFRKKFYAGIIKVNNKEGKKIYSLEVTGNLDTLDQNKQLLFEVVSPEESPDRE
jgi:hypothetical protein